MAATTTSNSNKLYVTSLSTDVLSYLMSYLDTRSYHQMSIINQQFHFATQHPMSYHGKSFELTATFWEYILSPKHNISKQRMQSILKKYKFSKKLEINPIKHIDDEEMSSSLYDIYGYENIQQIYDFLKTFDMTLKKKDTISFIFTFIKNQFKKLCYIEINDHYHCGNLYQLMPKFTKNNNNTTLHIKMVNKYDGGAFNAYCAAIFAHNTLSVQIRRESGLLLKQSLANNSFYHQSGQFIKKCLIQCLLEEDKKNKCIRDTSAAVISTIVQYNEFDEWPDLITNLLDLLKQYQKNTNPVIIQSILNVIHLLCHDCGHIMAECHESGSLIQALLDFVSSSDSKMTEYCLKSLYNLFLFDPDSLLNNIDKYINVLFQRMYDNNPFIMKIITRTIIAMMNEFWDRLSQQNNKIIVFQIFEFILSATMYDDNDISCIAAEFWALYACDHTKNNQYLIEFFPKLLPMLVKRCRYNNINDGNDDKDIWNIRKCCANQLEKLSICGGNVKNNLISIVLPIIKQALESENVLECEAGLFVLGAITQKEFESVIPSLPELISFIIKQCKSNKHVLVQRIAYWTLSRFSNWYYTTNDGGKFYAEILYQFLKGIKSNCKTIQYCSCGAMSTFITTTNKKILAKQEYIEALMDTFLTVFNNYDSKHIPYLMDVIISFVNVVAKNASNMIDNILNSLLPLVLKRWTASKNNFIFEAIKEWTIFIGHTQHFQKNYLKQIFITSLNIWDSVDLKNKCKTIDESSKPNKEFYVCTLNLLDVLVEKCNPSIKQLLWNEKTEFEEFYYQKFLDILYYAICETDFNVRRNGFALLGHLISLHSDYMKPHISKFLNIAINNLQWDWQLICSNASWCVGEALVVYQENIMDEYYDDILNHLIDIITCEYAPEYILTNIAITMARLIKAFPHRIIKKWDEFGVKWIQNLSMLSADNDKIQSFHTLMIVIKNPIIFQSENVCSVLLKSIANWENPPNCLNEQFLNVLLEIKISGSNWDNIMNNLHMDTQQILKNRYNI